MPADERTCPKCQRSVTGKTEVVVGAGEAPTGGGRSPWPAPSFRDFGASAATSGPSQPLHRRSPTINRGSRAGLGLDKGAGSKLGVRLPQFLARVHDDGALPGHRFLEGPARNQQEPDASVASLHAYLVAPIEQDK